MTGQAFTGWLLDVYDDPQDGAVLWLLGKDGVRHRLHQDFPVTFYAAGPASQLRALWRFLLEQPTQVELDRQERRDLFCQEPVTVLRVRVLQPALQPRLFQEAARRFPTLSFYDADLAFSLRYAAVYNTFPLAYCQIITDGQRLQNITVLDSPWDMDPPMPPLRVLSLELDSNPAHAIPACLTIRTTLENPRPAYRLPLRPERPLLVNLAAILNRHDPDLLLTTWGDTWLLPRLLALSRRCQIPLPLNRDLTRGLAHRAARSYFSYGRVVHVGQQTLTFGRSHIDRYNAMLFHDYDLTGVLELARVSALPIQTVARTSPGTGISAMQILTALRQDILVPWHKQQAERPKTALDLLRADQGGMVYQPLVGLHANVAEIDFISMYPSIMSHFNISPETVGNHSPYARPVPQLGICIDQARPGLVPQTLDPLLKKRVALKIRTAELPHWDPRRRLYKERAAAHKWLLVTCFGYLGYKNARFGRIEAHEAVTAYGREALLQAKEAAEDLGGLVLHLYVDGLWVKLPGASKVSDYQPLLDEISNRTGLPIGLDGIYRWVAFLPSRVDGRVPVPNRYFGVFQDGSLKMRGIEARRGDTPPFIAQTQLAMLERMARVPEVAQLPGCLPELLGLLRGRLASLRRRSVPLSDLVVSQKLSRRLEEYRTPSPAARAAAQLENTGKSLQPGQRVRFLYALGDPGVYAWDLPIPPDPACLDLAHYAELLLRAGATILQPLGVSEATLRDWLFNNAGYGSRPGVLPLNSSLTGLQQQAADVRDPERAFPYINWGCSS
jgi:DNA polymerase II